ncbi:TPA: hypothetical protein R0445_000295 [Salmonella enterica subsp. enterica serovar Hvittingfoss]|nr:hypothetical protein [Salmonella enterica subsp. enterica serovar Hvittingfoss]
MNLKNRQLTELISFASGNGHAVVICENHVFVKLPGPAGVPCSFAHVTLFETSEGEICIIKYVDNPDINGVKISAEHFRFIFVKYQGVAC